LEVYANEKTHIRNHRGQRVSPYRRGKRGVYEKGRLNSGNTSLLEAAILAGVNIADDYYKVLDTADNLRAQLKEYLDQAGKMKMEISELKREIMRLGK
jgi:cell division protein ZapA